MNDVDGKNEKLWLSTPTILSSCLAAMAIASIKCNEHYKVTVEISNREATVEVCGPAAFDLHSAGTVGVGVSGDEVVAGEVGIGFERLNTFDEEMAENEEFCAGGFEGGVESRQFSHQRC